MHLHVCPYIHVRIYMNTYDSVLPCNMEPKPQSPSLIATQELVNNVYERSRDSHSHRESCLTMPAETTGGAAVAEWRPAKANAWQPLALVQP